MSVTTTPPALQLIGVRRCSYLGCERKVSTTAAIDMRTPHNLDRRAQAMTTNWIEQKLLDDNVVGAHAVSADASSARRVDSTVRTDTPL